MAQIKANGVMLEYDVAGPDDGIPLILIMGFGAQMTSWTPTFRERMIGNGFRVIRFDNRDVGLSQKFDGIIPDQAAVAQALAAGQTPDVPYTLRDMAADAAGLLDELGIESAHVAGASMGGMIAQTVAIHHPKKTRSLISIFSSSGDPSLPRSTPEAQAALMSRPPSTARADVVAHGVKGRKTYASPRWAMTEDEVAGLIGAAYDRSYYPEGTLRQMTAIMAAGPRTALLPTLDVPALVLHGTADTLIPWQAGAHTASLIKGSEFVLIDGWGHDIPPAGVPTLTDYITAFARRVEATR